MSAVNSPATTNNNNTRNRRSRRHHRQNSDHRSSLPTKRKLEDYDCFPSSEFNGGDDDSTASGVPSSFSRHRKSSNSNCKGKSVVDAESDQSTAENRLFRGESSQSNDGIVSSPRLQLQFFVKLISGGKTLVLQADLGDTVELVHRKIQKITGIPLSEQRLIYRGKQLQWEQTLEACGVQNDAGLQMVGRMRSTDHPRAWAVISEIVDDICRLCRNKMPIPIPIREDMPVLKKLEQFMAIRAPDKGNEFTKTYGNGRENRYNKAEDNEYDETNKTDLFRIFLDACAPQALVMMFMSPVVRNRECADACIKDFVSFAKKTLDTNNEKGAYCATTVLEFCRLLRKSGADDSPLYIECRSTLGMMLEKVEVARRTAEDSNASKGEITFIAVQDVFPFLMEVGYGLVKDLENGGTLLRDTCDFSAFLQPVLSFTGNWNGNGKGKVSPLSDEFDRLFNLVNDLLCWIDKCLDLMELNIKKEKRVTILPRGWSQYLIILKELSRIAVCYPVYEDRLWALMSKNKEAVRALVLRWATRLDDHSWLLKHKDVLDFESRRHLAMLMFPEIKEDYEELHEMLIDRSQLLAESFEYISSAEPSSLHAGLFMEFKNEEATGPGVLREWFCLVCQAIFDPQNALFVGCPLDRRRFSPNPASKVDPLHIRYFRFAGRVLALALMHKIQIGVVLDRVFFLRLAGKCISVEDIKDADPCIYNSCKQILEMDPEFVDSDGLGLTFVTEVEELGSRKVVELCPGGKGRVVNSRNRKEYVHLIVQQRFVTSITEQVYSFGQGFGDILRDDKRGATFFESLELEDLDWMLHGSGSAEISVEDWKKHTEYNGYKKSDPQIVWFWEVVGKLSVEQKKTLLFFWTSVKYLPVEGFRGLASRVFIYKSYEPQDHLPSSHTCFYRLCIPPYSTKAIMQDRLQVIAQEHVGCSFGTW